MALINFKNVVQRREEDALPTYFQWPRSGESFSYQVSTDGGATYSAGSEAISELPTDGNRNDYQIPYSESERPSGTGLVLFLVDDGTDEGRIAVHVGPKEVGSESSSDGPTLSAYGPKRVRTKEMDIEQFDPEKLQRLKERETEEHLPEFCDVAFCKGER